MIKDNVIPYHFSLNWIQMKICLKNIYIYIFYEEDESFFINIKMKRGRREKPIAIEFLF